MIVAAELADGRGASADGTPRIGRNTLKRAFSILAALEAAGVRLVPAEATDRIVDAVLETIFATNGNPAVVYASAVAASPYAPEVRR